MECAKINEYLFNLKMYPNNKGFQCVRACILLLEKNLDSKISSVYYEASKKLGVSPKAVEQNIIYAIENAWLKADTAFLKKEFGNTILDTKCKPTSKQFLITLANKIYS